MTATSVIKDAEGLQLTLVAEFAAPVDPEDKTSGVVSLESTADGTRLTLQSTFRSAEQMEKMMNMGMVEGITLAMGQVDEILVS